LTAAEKLAENIAEAAITKVEVNILTTKTLKRVATAPSARVTTNARMTKLIVTLTFLLVF